MKIAKFLGWLIFGPIVWVILSIIATIIIGIALFQLAINKLPQKVSPIKDHGLTPPDKSVILWN